MPKADKQLLGNNEFASSYDHTETPWELLNDGRVVHNPSDTEHRQHARLIEVCQVKYAATSMFTAQGFSNAHLILSAPELLQIATELLECGSNREKLNRLTAKARRVVDEAHGGVDDGTPDELKEFTDRNPNFGPGSVEITEKRIKVRKRSPKARAMRYAKS